MTEIDLSDSPVFRSCVGDCLYESEESATQMTAVQRAAADKIPTLSPYAALPFRVQFYNPQANKNRSKKKKEAFMYSGLFEECAKHNSLTAMEFQ